MKTIFYGVNGEGLGHATRSMAVIESLPDYEVHVYTYGKALKFFRDLGHPHVHEIKGMVFSYKNKKVDYWATGKQAFGYFRRDLRDNLIRISADALRLNPSLFITDFEPSIPRAADVCKRPLVSIDNQHKFLHADLRELPLNLRMYCRFTGWTAKLFAPHPDKTVISTFHSDHIRTNDPDVSYVNGLIRRSVEAIPSSDSGHILLYLRPSVSEIVLQAVADLDSRFHVYGAYGGPYRTMLTPKANFNFRELGPDFIESLASCKAVISTAGNQLITEARYYGKPVLVIPEPNQYEQYVNAYYVEKLKIGKRLFVEEVDERSVTGFLNTFVPSAENTPNGVPEVTELIRGLLET